MSRLQSVTTCALSAPAKGWRLTAKAIFIEATYEDMKNAYTLDDDLLTEAHSNEVCEMLEAVETKFGIPIIYTSQYHALATEKAASWLSKHFTYWWLEQNNHGRMLIDTDGL